MAKMRKILSLSTAEDLWDTAGKQDEKGSTGNGIIKEDYSCKKFRISNSRR
jgi:hypothetical protein